MSETSDDLSEKSILAEPLGRAIGERYLTYALSTIMNRALPDARDGFKPVHRRILFAMRDMMPAIDKLNKSLARKAKQFSSYKKVGRTHLMDALPVTLGGEFASYTTALTVARDGIVSAKKELEKVALGGTAVGTGANTPNGYRKIAITELAKKSKLPLKPQQDMQYALQSRYAVANMSSALKNFSVELSKIANDIRLMASGPIAGLSELGIPAVHAGSSIMPGKVNPSLAECMNMICFAVIGNDTTVTVAAQAGQFELNVMLPVMLKAVLDSTDTVSYTHLTLPTKRIV
mgnify:CR=1 FL=1